MTIASITSSFDKSTDRCSIPLSNLLINSCRVAWKLQFFGNSKNVGNPLMIKIWPIPMFSSYQTCLLCLSKIKLGCLTNPNHPLKKSLSPGPTGLMVMDQPFTTKTSYWCPFSQAEIAALKDTTSTGVLLVCGDRAWKKGGHIGDVKGSQRNLLAWSDIHCLRNKRSKIHVFNEHTRFFLLLTKRLFNIKHPETS